MEEGTSVTAKNAKEHTFGYNLHVKGQTYTAYKLGNTMFPCKDDNWELCVSI